MGAPFVGVGHRQRAAAHRQLAAVAQREDPRQLLARKHGQARRRREPRRCRRLRSGTAPAAPAAPPHVGGEGRPRSPAAPATLRPHRSACCKATLFAAALSSRTLTSCPRPSLCARAPPLHRHPGTVLTLTFRERAWRRAREVSPGGRRAQRRGWEGWRRQTSSLPLRQRKPTEWPW
ncbi:MAG: hypothetical protein J3K34DRAFT_283024 [Monoraphidium minutum]|nr:MAG: hypothetical protein J3K34DRAFT_283024 [Monoraphidium minutum]